MLAFLQREDAHAHELTKPSASFRITPAICWPGGKSRLLKHLIPLIPKHTCYCEPFAGGLAVMLAKSRSDLEVINDANGDLVNFYRCVRFHQDVLLTELEFVLTARKEFKDFVSQEGLTDIQRAARWYYRNKLCFGGAQMDSFGVSTTRAPSARSTRLEAIRALNVRLDRVVIEHLDWSRCMELYDRTGTFFFLDPPYTDCNASMYSSWSTADVLRLKDRLEQLRGQWLLTLNDTPQIRAMFAHCKVESVKRQLGINNKGGDGKSRIYHELIIRPAGQATAAPA